MSDIQITKINPYFSVITEYISDFPSVAIGVFFQHGSRNETAEMNGISHLIEHMLFKGTKNKTAKDIAYISESAGAVIDGFTTREISGIYCRCLASEFDKMLDLMSEIISLPLFDPNGLEKEKQVIAQEIAESLDDPQEQVFALLFEALFQNHPLSFSSVGKVDTINKLTHDVIADYYFMKFLPSKVCISAAGNIGHLKLVDKLQLKSHQILASNPIPIIRPNIDTERTTIIQTRCNLTQLYAAAASPTFSYRDEERYGMIVLNNIWGGAMSSRLFQRVREQEGLAYSIFSFVDFYSDIGILGAYFVSDVKNQEKIYRCGYEETIKLQKDGITQAEFDNAINSCKGMLTLSSEDSMSRMIRNAKNDLLLNRCVSTEESILKFEQLSIDKVNALTVALPGEYSVANVGPIDQLDYLKQSGGPQKVIVKD